MSAHTISSIIFWIFVIAIAEQLSHFFFLLKNVLSLPVRAFTLPVVQRKAVSIVICARNEAVNLRKNLHAVLQQSYHDNSENPLFEVIVVNDRSTDDTVPVLDELGSQYNNLEVITITEQSGVLQGKKHAQNRGVEAAANEWLLFTDADCKPIGDGWIENMVYYLAEGKEIVAGYGGYYSRPGLLNKFIRWETLHTFLLYSAYILFKLPYMAVGRNMACTKTFFLKASSSTIWKQLPYGDDDMLVIAAATQDNMAVVCNPHSMTVSEPKATWKEWVDQKQRHLSTGKYYKPVIKALLGEYAITHALTWIVFFVALYYVHTAIIIIMMAARCIAFWCLWMFTSKRLGEKDLAPFFPLFDIGWMVYNFAFSPYIFLKNKKSWK